MVTFPSFARRQWLTALAAASLIGVPATAGAAPWPGAPFYGEGYDGSYGRPRSLPVQPAPYRDYGYRDYAYTQPVAPTWEEAERSRRCTIGRVVGGVVGGGIGYAASRYEGRYWAVPLGALVGSQLGCMMGSGR